MTQRNMIIVAVVVLVLVGLFFVMGDRAQEPAVTADPPATETAPVDPAAPAAPAN